MNRHEKLHNSTSSFLCTTCGKTFKSASSLSKHMMWHDPEKKKRFAVYRNNFKKAQLAKAAREQERESENGLFQF
jgi:predicted amidophosphoribosyltransferase